MNELGRKIKSLRRNNDISQEDMAFDLGVARQTVSKWERGSMKPTTENVKALCDYFGVESDYFLSDTYAKTLDKEVKDKSIEEKNNLEVVATVGTKKTKKKTVLMLVGIIVSAVLFVISLIIGIIATIISQQEDSGFETVSRYDFDWGKIVFFAIAIIALITLIVLLIYRKKYKNK